MGTTAELFAYPKTPEVQHYPRERLLWHKARGQAILDLANRVCRQFRGLL